ncbi:MAG: hypothetical protein R3266_02645, partial [Gemmatimonadota bacterium]|nr:hypothetical protein [Gemmatimonadota bacterium]
SARLSGRFEIGAARGGRWVLDMAHNLDGVERLLETAVVAELPRPWIAVVGILADKPWRAMLSKLAETLDGLVITRPGEAPRSRRWDPEMVATSLAGSLRCRVETVERLDEALQRGNELSGQGTVFVTGSAYTVGAARSWLDFPVTLEATRR